MSGFNLPPGCTITDIDHAYAPKGPCLVCAMPEGICECPRCPECGYVGDPRCEINQVEPLW